MSDPAGRALDGLSLASTQLHPDDIAQRAAEEAGKMGVDDLTVHLCDLEQRSLVHLARAGEDPMASLSIDGTVAGRAYRTETSIRADDGDGDGTTLWIPLLDSAERYGVVGVRTARAVDDGFLEELRAFTNLLGEIIANKAVYGDRISLTKRTREPSMAAEARWAMLPPLTYSGRNVTVSGILEPAYAIAGDAFDYAVNGDVVHLAIFDAVGHDLQAARIANLGVVAYRHSRRLGLGLVDTYLAMDEVLRSEFGDDKFVTAQLGQLTLSTGELRWINAGHPQPMIVRDGHRLDLASDACPPVGLASLGAGEAVVARRRLEPGDLVLFFTDGIVEARARDGEEFGRDRLGEFAERAVAAGQSIAETMRVLGHAVVDHQPGVLKDDASMVALAWHGPD